MGGLHCVSLFGVVWVLLAALGRLGAVRCNMTLPWVVVRPWYCGGLSLFRLGWVGS